MINKTIEIYTDGSCNPKYQIGGWAALILYTDEKIVLQGSETETTHNRMELMAVIKAIEFVLKEISEIILIKIYTDSQYVEQIPFRAAKLISRKFITKAGNTLQNADLIQKIICLMESVKIEFVKVKAHQKASDKTNYNREVDKLSRKIVRNQINSKP
ncbi:ribonuclease H [Bacteroidota bacterium]